MKQEFIIALDADGENFRSGLFKEDCEDLGNIRPREATRFPTPYHAQQRIEAILKEMPGVQLAMVIPVFAR